MKLNTAIDSISRFVKIKIQKATCLTAFRFIGTKRDGATTSVINNLLTKFNGRVLMARSGSLVFCLVSGRQKKVPYPFMALALH